MREPIILSEISLKIQIYFEWHLFHIEVTAMILFTQNTVYSQVWYKIEYQRTGMKGSPYKFIREETGNSVKATEVLCCSTSI